MREARPPREVPDIDVHGENLAPFLYGLKTGNRKAFEAVRRSLRAAIPAIDGLDVDLDTVIPLVLAHPWVLLLVPLARRLTSFGPCPRIGYENCS
jgi:hypothetical protein